MNQVMSTPISTKPPIQSVQEQEQASTLKQTEPSVSESVQEQTEPSVSESVQEQTEPIKPNEFNTSLLDKLNQHNKILDSINDSLSYMNFNMLVIVLTIAFHR